MYLKTISPNQLNSAVIVVHPIPYMVKLSTLFCLGSLCIECAGVGGDSFIYAMDENFYHNSSGSRTVNI